MRRLLPTNIALAMVAMLSFATSATAQTSTFSAQAVDCGFQFANEPGVYYVSLTGSITPVPSTNYDISLVSSTQGEVFHISLPAGFDISQASVSLRLPLGVVDITAFQDLNNNDVQNPGEPTIASTTLNRPCEPQRTQQCKEGGWRNFPWLGFKNEGNCVSYVATGYRNDPGQNQP
jgi:hypothetical protein